MTDLEKQDVPKKETDSFFSLKNMLSSLKQGVKEFLAPSKAIEKKQEQQEIISSKEQQEAGLVTNEILNLQKNVLIKNEIAITTPDLKNLKKSSLKKNISPYIPQYPDTQKFVEQSDRISAPWIAEQSDLLQNDIKGSPILNYFLG